MPTHLVNVIKQMYDGDEYVLIDDAKTTSTGNSTAPFFFMRCKTWLSFISSPLFLFINDVNDGFGTGLEQDG